MTQPDSTADTDDPLQSELVQLFHLQANKHTKASAPDQDSEDRADLLAQLVALCRRHRLDADQLHCKWEAAQLNGLLLLDGDGDENLPSGGPSSSTAITRGQLAASALRSGHDHRACVRRHGRRAVVRAAVADHDAPDQGRGR